MARTFQYPASTQPLVTLPQPVLPTVDAWQQQTPPLPQRVRLGFAIDCTDLCMYGVLPVYLPKISAFHEVNELPQPLRKAFPNPEPAQPLQPPMVLSVPIQTYPNAEPLPFRLRNFSPDRLPPHGDFFPAVKPPPLLTYPSEPLPQLLKRTAWLAEMSQAGILPAVVPYGPWQNDPLPVRLRTFRPEYLWSQPSGHSAALPYALPWLPAQMEWIDKKPKPITAQIAQDNQLLPPLPPPSIALFRQHDVFPLRKAFNVTPGGADAPLFAQTLQPIFSWNDAAVYVPSLHKFFDSRWVDASLFIPSLTTTTLDRWYVTPDLPKALATSKPWLLWVSGAEINPSTIPPPANVRQIVFNVQGILTNTINVTGVFMALNPTPLQFPRFEAVTIIFAMSPTVAVAGWTFTFTIRQLGVSQFTTSTVTINDAGIGTFQVVMTTTQTSALAVGVYDWDIWRTNAGSESRLAFGNLLVTTEQWQ